MVCWGGAAELMGGGKGAVVLASAPCAQDNLRMAVPPQSQQHAPTCAVPMRAAADAIWLTHASSAADVRRC
jgi:hypothetical protein